MKQVHDQQGRSVKPEDFRAKCQDVLGTVAQSLVNGDVHTVVVVHINSAGKAILASSVGTPQTVNLLEQAWKIATGKLEPDDGA